MIRAIVHLIERGHDLDKVLYRYTLDQLRCFFKETVKNEMDRQLSYAVAVRIAVNGNDKVWKNFVKSMTAEIGNKPKQAVSTMEEVMRAKELMRRHGRHARNR